MANIINSTYSVCPECLKRIPADITKHGNDYYIDKTCPDHGSFCAVIWRGDIIPMEEWGNYTAPSNEQNPPDCPNSCGLCSGHLQKTCCALVEITEQCNLNCPICFAQSGGSSSREPSVSELSDQFKKLAENGNTFIHLSGGEPTVRNDLPDIVAAAKDAGCESIQLNSNGIRLGQDKEFTKNLAQAGLSFVFMQFDGTEDPIYEKLRGKPLFSEKQAAIDACSSELIGVTLVPTLVPGINDHNIGEILKFGFGHSPAVRGVHFQPVSYFGRYPNPPENRDRITLPEVLHLIEKQTEGRVNIRDFLPSVCDHPRCGFHGDFVVLPEGLMKLTPKSSSNACCSSDGTEHLKNRNFVSRRWKRTAVHNSEEGNYDISDFDGFLRQVETHGFTITAMAFQDAYTLDIERLRRCSLHVYKDGRTIPFCSRYLTRC